MKQIKKYIIIFLILSIITIAVTPVKKKVIEPFPFEGDINRAINNVVNDVVAPVRAEIARVATDMGMGDSVELIDNLMKIPTYIINITKAANKINVSIATMGLQSASDGVNITNVMPAITICAKRIRNCIQRGVNIIICIKLIHVIFYTTPIYWKVSLIRCSINTLLQAIKDFYNYNMMALRTCFIDLHNTSPPLWDVIASDKYKSHTINIINNTKTIARNINNIIDVGIFCLTSFEKLMNKPLIKGFDPHKLTRTQIGINKTLLTHSKLTIINLPDLGIVLNGKPLYESLLLFVQLNTIPPNEDLAFNKAYIQNNIRNHPTFT